MAKISEYPNSDAQYDVSVSLPPPLDKPMEGLNLADEDLRYTGREIAEKLNQLIERQNALLEVVKRMFLK